LYQPLYHVVIKSASSWNVPASWAQVNAWTFIKPSASAYDFSSTWAFALETKQAMMAIEASVSSRIVRSPGLVAFNGE
jgi:hypothetical protein